MRAVVGTREKPTKKYTNTCSTTNKKKYIVDRRTSKIYMTVASTVG